MRRLFRKVPPQWLILPRVFEPDYDYNRFAEDSSGADLDLPGWAGGCVLEDFDGDGFLDLMSYLLRNKGDGTK